MIQKTSVCRQCESLFLKPFAIPGSAPHYAPDRPFQLEHISFRLFVDPRSKELSGTVTQTVKAITADQTELRLDQVGLEIEKVLVQGEAVSYSRDDQSLTLSFSQAPQEGESLDVTIHYRVRHPRRGIYFVGPDSDYPDKPYQVWTQGQDEDSRHWFPTLDYPNQKATTEMIVEVPTGFVAVSNGALISRKESQSRTCFHYRLGVAHVTYLVSLVVAKFSEWADLGPRGLDIRYYVPAGREEDGKRAFGKTPKMIEAFEKVLGVAYPYEKYSQVAVQDFIFGGMENTSATTQTDLTLHDVRAHLDFSSDPLVSHELAHQWFGDWVTCRDWSHGWLNEGFATFMERVWIENDSSQAAPLEEAKYYSYHDLKIYLDDDQKKYRRPLVCNNYIEPIDLFDSHLYQKGGLVLNLIRGVLGDRLFWKSIQLYLNRHREKTVETLDLVRAIEDATGRNLRRLFDEWVFSEGYPEFEVSFQWHKDKKLAEWIIEQKQKEGTQIFHLPVVLEMTLADGKKIRQTVELGESRERLFLSAPSQPVRVRFDPNFTIPKTLKFPRSKELLLYQLKHDPDCMGRIEAIQELVKKPDLEILKGIGESALKDPFWGVQVEAVTGLSEIRRDESRDLLIEALSISNPKVRRAVSLALGTFKDEKSAQALKKLAISDPSYFVEADSISSWASTYFRSALKKDSPVIDEVEAFLIKKLEVPSYREVIRGAALKALADLPGLVQCERPQVFEVLIDWTQRGRPMDARVAAVRALGQVLKQTFGPYRKKILALFDQLADEDQFRIRMQLVTSLSGSGCIDGVPILLKIECLDFDGRVKRGARTAVDVLRSSGGLPDLVWGLKASLEKLEEDHRKLRACLQEQEQRVLSSE